MILSVVVRRVFWKGQEKGAWVVMIGFCGWIFPHSLNWCCPSLGKKENPSLWLVTELQPIAIISGLKWPWNWGESGEKKSNSWPMNCSSNPWQKKNGTNNIICDCGRLPRWHHWILTVNHTILEISLLRTRFYPQLFHLYTRNSPQFLDHSLPLGSPRNLVLATSFSFINVLPFLSSHWALSSKDLALFFIR